MSAQTDEQRVREVIDSAMAGTRPPHDLAPVALARGRRLRIRRRAGYAAAGITASVALAVAVAVAAPWVAAGGDRPVRGGDLVATQPPSPAPVPPARKGWWDMPATDMVAAVEAILPDGVVVTEAGPLEADTPEGGPASGWIAPQLAGTSGPGGLNLILYAGTTFLTTCLDCHSGGRGATVSPTPGVGCGGEFSSDRARCEELVDDQGQVIGRRLTERWTDAIVINQVVLRRDGGTVYAASVNTLDDKWRVDSPLSADRPPLTLDQLEDLVRNDVWVSYRS